MTVVYQYQNLVSYHILNTTCDIGWQVWISAWQYPSVQATKSGAALNLKAVTKLSKHLVAYMEP
jgi:hypothetical protein